MSVNYTPDGYHTVTPYLIVDNGTKALDFYRDAFGANELFRLPLAQFRQSQSRCIRHQLLFRRQDLVAIAIHLPERPAHPFLAVRC